MQHVSAIVLSVEATEGVKNIVRSSCLPTTASCRDDEDNRVKFIGYPTFARLLGASLHRRQHLVTTCIHNDRRPLRTPRSRRSPTE